MILNINGFENGQRCQSKTKQNSEGALKLTSAEFEKIGFIVDTSLVETFVSGVPMAYIKFWFYYEKDNNGKFFSINDNKLNLFIDEGSLQVQANDIIRNITYLEPNTWHLLSVKISSGINAFWKVETNNAMSTEVFEQLDLNYFVMFYGGDKSANYFDNLIISDSISDGNQIWPIKTNIKLNHISKQSVLIYNLEKTGNVKAYKVIAECECEENSKFNLQIRQGSRLQAQTAYTNKKIEKLIEPKKNIEIAIGSKGSIDVKKFEVYALY